MRVRVAGRDSGGQLEAVQETSYPALADLTPAAVARNEDTIQNIRLWDSRPLLQTYQQTQAIRLYYQFYNVGVDRYHLADGYHQVMLSTRELSPELPAQAQTWVKARVALAARRCRCSTRTSENFRLPTRSRRPGRSGPSRLALSFAISAAT